MLWERENETRLAVFRALSRELARLPRGGSLALPPPLSLADVASRYGRGGYVDAPPPPPAVAAGAPEEVPPPPLPPPRALVAHYFPRAPPAVAAAASAPGGLSRAALRAAAAAAFRARAPRGELDDALACLAALARVRAAAPCFAVTTTETPAGGAGGARGARVVVAITTTFVGTLPPSAHRAARHWPFAYRVRVTNAGGGPVQVLSRGWTFVDAVGRGAPAVVPPGSAGVVGHAPVLGPGQGFEYVSGVTLAAERGSGRGVLGLVECDTGVRFEAAVGPVELVAAPLDWGARELDAGWI